MHDGRGERFSVTPPRQDRRPCTTTTSTAASNDWPRSSAAQFSHAQAMRAGGSDPMLARRLNTGQLLRLDAGVYALALVPGQLPPAVLGGCSREPGAGVAGWRRPTCAFPAFARSTGDRRGPGRQCSECDRHRSPVRLAVVDDATDSGHVPGGDRSFDIAAAGRDRSPRARHRRPVADRSDSRSRISTSDSRSTDATCRAGLRVMRRWSPSGAEGFVPPASELERRADRIVRRLKGEPIVVAEAAFRGSTVAARPCRSVLPDEESCSSSTDVAGTRGCATSTAIAGGMRRRSRRPRAAEVHLRHVTTRPRRRSST